MSARHRPNDGSPLLWVPLLVLCIGAVGAGYLGVFGGPEHGGWFHSFLPGLCAGGACRPGSEGAAGEQAAKDTSASATTHA